MSFRSCVCVCSCSSSFNCIYYLYVSLSCRTGSFPLSLQVVPILFLFVFFSVLSYLSIRLFSPVVPDLFLSLYVLYFFYRIYQSVSLSFCTGSFLLSLRLVLCSTVSIDPSLYRVIRYLVSSLYVLFRPCCCSSSSSSY